MRNDLADLGVTAAAIDLLHERAEPLSPGHPLRRPAFAESAIIDQLDIEATDRGGFAKHVGLQPACRVPQRLAAHGRIERKDQPTPPAGLVRGSKDLTLLRKASISEWPERPAGTRSPVGLGLCSCDHPTWARASMAVSSVKVAISARGRNGFRSRSSTHSRPPPIEQIAMHRHDA